MSLFLFKLFLVTLAVAFVAGAQTGVDVSSLVTPQQCVIVHKFTLIFWTFTLLFA